MKKLTLYAKYTRNEAISNLIPTGHPIELSSGELVVYHNVGIIFTEIGQPPSNTYCLSRKEIRWFSTETSIQFYNSTMLSFPSQYRKSNKTLHLFGKIISDESYFYLGTVSVVNGECPSTHKSAEFPAQVIVQMKIESELPLNIWSEFDWSNKNILINGLPLPYSLCVLITEGRWKSPTDPQKYQNVFNTSLVGSWFLIPDQMERHSKQLILLCDEGFGSGYALSTTERVDGLLNPSRAICLGSTGPDEPFCIDYQTSENNAQVIYLVGNQPHWQTIAHNVDDFASRLGL